MLDADMNARYWKYLVSRYSVRDRNLKIFLAVMASGTVAGWGIWESIPGLWKSLSALSAVVAISLPIFNFPKSIEQMSALAGKWGELRIQYEDLWREVRRQPDTDALEQSYKKFRSIESSLQEKETTLPINKALLQKCFDEVKKARNL